MDQVLQGKKSICGFLGRSWPIIASWISHGAPIVRIHGKWEADGPDLLEWRRQYIRQMLNEPENNGRPAQGMGLGLGGMAHD